MRKKRRSRIRGRSGETLVEIMVSGVLFLTLMAVIQGAVSFCTNAQQRSRETRRANAAICNALRKTEDAPGVSDGEASMVFEATSADGTVHGNQVFEVTVKLEKRTITAEGKTAVFYSFAPGSTGGGAP